MSYLKSYLKSCKKPLGKPDFPRFFLHNLRYNLRYDFEDVLSAPPPAAARSCQQTARVHCPPPPSRVPSAAQSPCVVSSAPLLLWCHPPPDRLTIVSPFPPCLRYPPLPSHRVVRHPPAFPFNCCVLDRRRRDVVADQMSCVVRPFPPTVLSAARLLRVL